MDTETAQTIIDFLENEQFDDFSFFLNSRGIGNLDDDMDGVAISIIDELREELGLE